MSETLEEQLILAVHRYLDEFYEADSAGDSIPWPAELERLSLWEVPDE